MGAAGPSFRERFEDDAPASNADIGMTIARLLRLNIQPKGKLMGRELTEAMPNGSMPPYSSATLRSGPDAMGNVTVLLTQKVGDATYFDSAGYAGRTLGLPGEASRPPPVRAEARSR
jgi:hypothetical protein